MEICRGSDLNHGIALLNDVLPSANNPSVTKSTGYHAAWQQHQLEWRLCYQETLLDLIGLGAGRSHNGINEEIIWVSIGMGITIAILITIALCYIMREKCKKRNEYYITA
uniref:Uncharacterized protein n=1 Tax=Timema tahoe TaxID=61484 RepID=A0A7R9IF63_9NEOP|nr:unnamed protein product [Timema tahoe]